MNNPLPVVGIPVDVKQLDGAPYHIVGEKYVNAIVHGAHCYPMFLPAMDAGGDLRTYKHKFSLRDIVARLDGVFLPGSYSNVHPKRYGAEDSPAMPPIDHQRDDMVLELIHTCIDHQVPVLAVCRGFQELNVAFGGSIQIEIHELDEYHDHRENYELPRDQQYQHAHPVEIKAGGLLHRIHGDTSAMVNSLHGQGIDRLGEGLSIEAVAPDNLVEAVSLDKHDGFVLGVQWHPEWRFWEDPLSTAIFEAFQSAVLARQNIKHGISNHAG